MPRRPPPAWALGLRRRLGYGFAEEILVSRVLIGIFVLGSALAGVSGCASRSETVGTIGGVAAGAAVGSSVSGGSTLGTAAGAAVGGYAGNKAGERYHERHRD